MLSLAVQKNSTVPSNQISRQLRGIFYGHGIGQKHDWPLSNPPFLPVWGLTMYAIKNAPNYHTFSIRIGDVGLNCRLPWSSTNGTPLTNKDPRGPLLPLPIVHPLLFCVA